MRAIKLLAAVEQGCAPPRLLGRFNKAGELVAAQIPDGGPEWRREGVEPPEAFEARIVEDLARLALKQAS